MSGGHRALLAATLALCWSSASAADIPLSSLAACGARMEASAPCATCEPSPTSVVGDAWHGLAQCFRSLRNAWSRNGAGAVVDVEGRPTIAAVARSQVWKEVNGAGVGFARLEGGRAVAVDRFPTSGDVDLFWRRNDLGEPYNAMGQTGLAYFLYSFAGLAAKGGYAGAEDDARTYVALARAAARTALTPVGEGGLASYRACDGGLGTRCAWFHSVTRRDRRADLGGTLNQMLHAVRDLGLMADLEIETDPAIREQYDRAVDAGLDQLFHGAAGGTPTLADFASDRRAPASGKWAYYSMALGGAADGKRGYFLKQPGKNCGYQVHSLALLKDILRRQAKRGRADFLAEDWLACRSPAVAFYNAIRLRKAAGTDDRLTSCDAAVDGQMVELSAFYAPAATQCEPSGR